MKVMVTGGKGFIAQHYIKKMTEEGHECFIYDLPENDINDTVALRMHVIESDLVVHFAAMADVTVCIKKQRETFETNVLGTFNVGQICAEYNKPLLNISTCCVYGNSPDNYEMEDYTKPNAKEPYAVSKIAGEYLLAGIPDLKHVNIRVGTVYGVGMREALFTYIALHRVKNQELIYIDGDGNQTRQLIYIDDLINGIARASVEPHIYDGESINLCGTETISANDTVKVAEVIIGKKAITENRAQRYGQTFHENISIEKAEELLGWSPNMDFSEGMKYTYENDGRFK